MPHDLTFAEPNFFSPFLPLHSLTDSLSLYISSDSLLVPTCNHLQPQQNSSVTRCQWLSHWIKARAVRQDRLNLLIQHPVQALRQAFASVCKRVTHTARFSVTPMYPAQFPPRFCPISWSAVLTGDVCCQPCDRQLRHSRPVFCSYGRETQSLSHDTEWHTLKLLDTETCNCWWWRMWWTFSEQRTRCELAYLELGKSCLQTSEVLSKLVDCWAR